MLGSYWQYYRIIMRFNAVVVILKRRNVYIDKTIQKSSRKIF